MNKLDSIMGRLFDDLEPEREPDLIWGNRLDELARERDRVNRKPYGRQDKPTTDEPVVLDWQQSKDAMREAIERCDENADPNWKQMFWDALVHCARSEESFSADHIWERLAQLPHVPNTVDNRAAGAVILRAVRRGVIRLRPKSQPYAFEESKRRHCHRMLIRRYDSLVYGKDEKEIPAYG